MSEDRENASELALCPDFEDATPLFVSEVSVLLDRPEFQRASSEILAQTREYVQAVGTYDNIAAAISVRKILAGANLHEFEIAQIATLAPTHPEEAYALIPSLRDKLPAHDLAKILSQCRDLCTK